MNKPEERSGFVIERHNTFFEANRRIVEYEIRASNTVSFFCEVDLTEIENMRCAAGRERPSYTAFVAKATALSLREFPYANRRICRRGWLPWARPRLQRFRRFDIAIAVERDVPGAESAAFVDVLRDADQRSWSEMTQWLSNLATCDITNNKQWRDFSQVISRLPHCLSSWLIRLPYLAPSAWEKFRGGAVLISAPAKYGVDGVVASWSWPLGISFGFAKERPMVKDGNVVPCSTFLLSMNFDRRIMAGAPAARFFKRIVDHLESPKEAL